jgi:hypothetical protein
MKKIIHSTNDGSGPSRTRLVSTYNDLVTGNLENEEFWPDPRFSHKLGIGRRRLEIKGIESLGLKVSIFQTSSVNLKFKARSKGKRGLATVGRLVATEPFGRQAALLLRTFPIRISRLLPMAIGAILAIATGMDYAFNGRRSYELFAPLSVFVASFSLQIPRHRDYSKFVQQEESAIEFAFRQLCGIADPHLLDAVPCEMATKDLEKPDNRKAALFFDIFELLLNGGFMMALFRFLQEKERERDGTG